LPWSPPASVPRPVLSLLVQGTPCGPLFHIEVILDVAVAQHEVLADLNGDQVLGRQVGHHVDVFDASVRMLDVQVECLLVQNRRCGVLVLVGPAPHLDHAFHKRDNELGMLLGHDIGARDDGGDIGHLQGPVWIPGQVLDRLELARRLLESLEDDALGIDRIAIPAISSLPVTMSRSRVGMTTTISPFTRKLSPVQSESISNRLAS